MPLTPRNYWNFVKSDLRWARYYAGRRDWRELRRKLAIAWWDFGHFAGAAWRWLNSEERWL